MLKNNKGFTLIEMLIVMLVISVLLLLIIPNLTNRSEGVHEQGCDALVSLVQAQADSYYLDEGEKVNDINTLVPEYLDSNQTSCKEGNIQVNGGVAKGPNG